MLTVPSPLSVNFISLMLEFDVTPSWLDAIVISCTIRVSPSRVVPAAVMVWPEATLRSCQLCQTSSGVTSAKAPDPDKSAIAAVLPASFQSFIFNPILSKFTFNHPCLSGLGQGFTSPLLLAKHQ